jgi:sugar phosphate isomerase/epimerase
MNFTRRHFIKATGTGIAAVSLPALGTVNAQTPAPASKNTFRLAVAGYSFAKINLDQSLAMMKRIGVSSLGVKDFHVPLNSTQEVIDQTLAKMKTFGVEPYGVGPIYLKSEDAVEQAFAYAQRVGVKLLVAVPDVQFLPYVEKKVKESNIRVAIHNHGPDIPLYPSAGAIWAEIKNLDPRIGFCLDIGHTLRLGLDPVEAFNQYQDRIFDFHVWDCDKAEKAGVCVEAGRGIIDFPAFFKALIKAKYSGTVSLEYTKDMTDPLPGIAESIGYFRGVLAGLS